jgi:hypothetical protein
VTVSVIVIGFVIATVTATATACIRRRQAQSNCPHGHCKAQFLLVSSTSTRSANNSCPMITGIDDHWTAMFNDANNRGLSNDFYEKRSTRGD